MSIHSLINYQPVYPNQVSPAPMLLYKIRKTMCYSIVFEIDVHLGRNKNHSARAFS